MRVNVLVNEKWAEDGKFVIELEKGEQDLNDKLANALIEAKKAKKVEVVVKKEEPKKDSDKKETKSGKPEKDK